MSNDEIIPLNPGEVLRRAIELDQDPVVESHRLALDRHTLSDIADELGVSPGALAEAIAGGQAGVPTERTLIDRLVGPRWVWSSRTVAAGDEQTRQRLVEWLSVTHGLRPRVRHDGVIVARKRRDLAGKLGSSLRRVQGLGELSTVTRVQAAAVVSEKESDGASSLLCLAADVSAQRKEAIVGGSAAAVGTAVVLVAVAVATAPVALVGLPVSAGVGAVVARRSHRATVERMTDTVEDTVDGVARGEAPQGPLGGLTRRLKPSRKPDKDAEADEP